MRHTCRLTILLLGLLLLALAGCDDDKPNNSLPDNVYIFPAVNSHCTPLTFAISAGQTVTITTTDSVITNPTGSVADCDFWTDADGIPDCHYVSERSELHDLPFMALIGEFNGEYFLVGVDFTRSFAEDGDLNLTVNDWGGCGDDSDNEGRFVITVDIE